MSEDDIIEFAFRSSRKKTNIPLGRGCPKCGEQRTVTLQVGPAKGTRIYICGYSSSMPGVTDCKFSANLINPVVKITDRDFPNSD